MAPYRRIGVAVGAFALVLTVVGASFQILLVPSYTRLLVGAVDSSALADLPPAETFALAESVRAYVAGSSAAQLPARLPDGRAAFSDRAVSHLDDVRDVLAGARMATLAAALLAAAWVAWTWRGGADRRRLLAGSLRAAAGGLLGTLGMFVLAAVIDFSGFFVAFHALFFEGDTWLFPQGELLILLFPEAFWAASGAAVALLVALAAAGLGLGSRHVSGNLASRRT